MIINVLPNAFYSLAHGTSIGTLDRSAPESEIYAFKLAQLLLPWPDHMITALRNLRGLYDQYYPLVSEEPALGFLAATGLVAAFLIIAYLVVGWRSLARSGLAQQTWFRTSTELSSLLLVAFLFGTVGGISTLISFVTPDMRGWNRIAIMMSILCLAIVGLLLDRAIWRIADRIRVRNPFSIVTTRRVVATVIAGVLVVVAFVDQTPFNASQIILPTQSAFSADQRYFTTIQRDLPPQSMVLQLPYIRFPEEAAPNGTLGTDELIPFLHTSTIRWTAGGIKGRPAADWPDQVSQYNTPQMLTLAAAANMSGILLDTYAYDDQGKSLISSLTGVLGKKPLVSSTGRWVFFDVRNTRAALSARVPAAELRAVAADLTNPVMPYMAPDFNATVTAQRVWGGTSSKPAPRMTLVNPENSIAHGTLSMQIGNNSLTGSAVVTLPDGSRHTVPIRNGTGMLNVQMDVPPGINVITVSSPIGGVPAPILISHVHFESNLVAQFLAHAAS
jgi:phosphoglycerol transferase